MKRALSSAILLAIITGSATAQQPDGLPVTPRQRLDGPRIGMMVVSGRNAEGRLQTLGVSRTLTVFGWHTEQIIQPVPGGPLLVVQEIVTLAGAEQEALLPAVGASLGVRLRSGFEIGVGPNLSAFGVGMAVNVGQSIRYGSATIPLTLSVVSGQEGTRFSLLVGYAIRRR